VAQPTRKKPLLLVVLDGWGIRVEREANAIAVAGTPNMDALTNEFPHTALMTSGNSVGLPEGQMGNSEVGHTNLGAGRIVYQDLVRINRAVEDGDFFRNDALLLAARRAREHGGALHLLGLLSDGGVHSHEEHLAACIELARREGVARVFVHAFMDGRDTPPRSGLEYMAKLEKRLRETGHARVASVSGRYYAMDRDKRWDRVALAYATLVKGDGKRAASGVAAVEQSYAADAGDEFVLPTVIVNGDGKPVGPVRDGDAVVFFNFRADRARRPGCRPTSA
jgi:2,3-bisphosphoglycerate-independent phosphoglycerate mutase